MSWLQLGQGTVESGSHDVDPHATWASILLRQTEATDFGMAAWIGSARDRLSALTTCLRDAVAAAGGHAVVVIVRKEQRRLTLIRMS